MGDLVYGKSGFSSPIKDSHICMSAFTVWHWLGESCENYMQVQGRHQKVISKSFVWNVPKRQYFWMWTFRPDFFYFMVYRHFCSLSNVGIWHKNKNKISVIPDIHWLSSKRKPILTLTKKQTIQNDRKLNSRHFDTE